MADETHVLRGIDWRETFSFTHLFRAFRVAVHPTKLVLGLLFLLSFFVGGKVLDAIWPSKHRAVANEIAIVQSGTRADREAAIRDARDTTIGQYAWLLDNYGVKEEGRTSRQIAEAGGSRKALLAKIIERRDAALTAAAKERDETIAEADKRVTEASDETRTKERERRDKTVQEARDEYRDARATAFSQAATAKRTVDGIKGHGIFTTFFDYQITQFEHIIAGVISWNWLPTGPVAGPAVLPSIWNFIAVGPSWLIHQHFVFFVLLTVLFLATWSYFGGAIARIAAVQVARDEKISFLSARRFAGGKLMSFAFAPLIPLVIVLVLWALVWLLGVIGNIPGVGPVVVGLLFFLVLIAAGVMALLLIGLIGGFNLMYPAIAVEGSDSVDAISRSFSYLYSKPWRLLFYTFVALVYGALTYLFVRFFVYLLLAVAHGALGAGIWADAASGQPLLHAMWEAPTLHSLTATAQTWQLGGGQTIGAWLINFWVYLAAALVGAFAISFYFSAHTIIYYLLRREVDSTEMDDVYIEQTEDEFDDGVEAVSVTTTTVTAGTIAVAPAVVEDTSTPGGSVSESPVPEPGPSGADQPAIPADESPSTDAGEARSDDPSDGNPDNRPA